MSRGIGLACYRGRPGAARVAKRESLDESGLECRRKPINPRLCAARLGLVSLDVSIIQQHQHGPLCHATLLVVDDRGEIREALRRFFSLTIAQVIVAGTANEAEQALRNHRPNLLLCDYYLGHDNPPATVLIARWRQDFPFLKRVAIMTGTRGSSLGPCSAVDAIFEKPLNMREVTDFLVDATKA